MGHWTNLFVKARSIDQLVIVAFALVTFEINHIRKINCHNRDVYSELEEAMYKIKSLKGRIASNYEEIGRGLVI